MFECKKKNGNMCCLITFIRNENECLKIQILEPQISRVIRDWSVRRIQNELLTLLTT